MADVIEEIIIDSDENEEIIPKSPELLAETKKEIGNKLYKTKQYRSALPLYTEAIELCPETAAYYGNRAACYIMLNRFEEALDDARKSIQLDSNFEKGYLRILKCGIALGDLMTAENAARSLQEIQPNNNAYSNELKSLERLKQYEADAVKAYDNRDYRKVVYCMDRCMDDAPHCTRYQTTKAECLTYLGRYQQAQDIVTTILHVKRGNADAIYVRGLCLLYDDNIDSAFNHFQQVLRLAPDHKKAMEAYKRAKLLKQKKAEGNDAFKACRFQEAVQLYTEALLIDPLNKKTNSKLYFNRATALSRLTKLKEAVEDCNAALNLDNNYLKALLRRAKCYMDLSEFEDAVKDYEKAYKMDRSRDNKRLLTEAKMALKRAKRKDFYKILGVQKNASEDEIKKAYKKGALIHHPDRHASASENEKKEQEKKFKELGEAYSVLSDPRKKARYDNGEDLDETGGVQPDFDPAQVFQEFFGEGNGPGFFTQSGFPGGFSFQFG